MFSQDVGIADRYQLDHKALEATCRELWHDFSIRPSSEDEYWEQFQTRTGVRPTRDEIASAERNIWIHPDLGEAFEHCASRNVTIAVLSDNTQFWFAKQREWAPELQRVAHEDLFLSNLFGCSKWNADHSTMHALAARHEPGTTVFIEDRARNINVAKERGFRTIHYTAGPKAGELKRMVEAALAPAD
jgi:FMN phosphatase YigB (HAD superfamily)